MSVQSKTRGRPRSTIPSYRLHKRSGQAVVTIDGRDVYLGPHGSDQSRARYGEIIGKIARHESIDAERSRESTAHQLTVDELLDAYFAFCQVHYVKHGKPTSEVSLVAMTIKPLHEKYGDVPAALFGPRLLKAFREDLIGFGWCRNMLSPVENGGAFRGKIRVKMAAHM